MTPADFGKFIAEDTEKWGRSHTREQYQCRVSEPALQS